jgi:hypothetical protein
MTAAPATLTPVLLLGAADGYAASVALSTDGAVAAVGVPYRDHGSSTDAGTVFMFKVSMHVP